MVYLIADLLNISRLKTGKLVIEPTSINLAEIIEQEIDQLKDNARSHRIKIKYLKPKDFPKKPESALKEHLGHLIEFIVAGIAIFIWSRIRVRRNL